MTKLKDNKTGLVTYIVNKTANSYEVKLEALSKAGITTTNWFEQSLFDRRFTILNEE